jgi:hypothetical protein
MIEMVKKEKQKEILIDLMNMDDGETKEHLSVGEKMIKMVSDAKQKSINNNLNNLNNDTETTRRN